jgi:hypothetical protein
MLYCLDLWIHCASDIVWRLAKLVQLALSLPERHVFSFSERTYLRHRWPCHSMGPQHTEGWSGHRSLVQADLYGLMVVQRKINYINLKVVWCRRVVSVPFCRWVTLAANSDVLMYNGMDIQAGTLLVCSLHTQPSEMWPSEKPGTTPRSYLCHIGEDRSWVIDSFLS